jgi:acylphosphatase
MNSSLDTYCIHAFVSGRVQGVWFRAFVKEQAVKKRVAGWAKNLDDGRVEVLLVGQRQNVEQLVTEIAKGPRLAKVNQLEQEVILPPQNITGFTIS